MSETPETATVRIATGAEPAPIVITQPAQHRSPKIYQAAAWVAVIAGVVFITATIFFTGFILGKNSSHGGCPPPHHHHMGHEMMGPPGGHPPMGHPGGPGGPGDSFDEHGPAH